MGNLVVSASASELRPATNDQTHVAGGFGKGAVYLQASGVGSGTWSATFNVAPVSAAGVVGTVRQLVVSNATPMADLDVLTGVSTFMAWWTAISGTVVATGTVSDC